MEFPHEPKSATVHVDDLTPGRSRLSIPSQQNVLERVSHEVFRYDHLDRQLKRHHITGNLSSSSLHAMYAKTQKALPSQVP